MSIVRISEDLKQEFTIDSEGKATVTIRGAARLLDIDESSLREACRAGIKLSKLAEKLIESGFNPAGFFVTGIPDVAFAVMVEYYAFDANQKPKQAKDLCRSFLAIGIRTWIQNQLEYQSESEIERYPYLLREEGKGFGESIFDLTMFQLECLHLHALMVEAKMPKHKTLLQYIDPIYHDMPLDAVKSQQWYRQMDQKQHLLEPRIEYKKVRYALVENTGIEKEIERMKREVKDERDSYMYACVKENQAAARFSSKVTRRFTMRRTKALKEASYSGLF